MAGEDTAPGLGNSGVYGKLGVASSTAVSPSLCGAEGWVDGKDFLWLFGGEGPLGPLNALWRFDPTTNQWAWMGGSQNYYQAGGYGARGVPSSSNSPGGRCYAVTWIDSNGNVWQPTSPVLFSLRTMSL